MYIMATQGHLTVKGALYYIAKCTTHTYGMHTDHHGVNGEQLFCKKVVFLYAAKQLCDYSEYTCGVALRVC